MTAVDSKPTLAFFSDVQIYALRKKTEEALAALRRVINEGWRQDWWHHLEINPNLDSIRDEPAFQSMVQEIRADMATQLERVRTMEPTGEVCAEN